MAVLVTGASGFVGRNLIPYLTEKGYSGVAVSRRKVICGNGWRWLPRSSIENSDGASPVDTIIHLEVKHHIESPRAADLQEFHTVNVEGTHQWLRWAGQKGISRFVFFSSIKAAGSSPHCQDETAAGLPDTDYGISKLNAEKAVQEWAVAEPDRSAIIVRPAVIYGPGNQANIFAFADAIYRNRFFLVGPNQNRKSIISIKNVAAAVAHLLALPLSGVNLFYLTDRDTYTVAELAEMMTRLLKTGKPLHHLPVALARAAAWSGDILSRAGVKFPLNSNRLKALLETSHFSCRKLQQTGFSHPQSTFDGIGEMVSWYLQVQHGKN